MVKLRTLLELPSWIKENIIITQDQLLSNSAKLKEISGKIGEIQSKLSHLKDERSRLDRIASKLERMENTRVMAFRREESVDERLDRLECLLTNYINDKK